MTEQNNTISIDQEAQDIALLPEVQEMMENIGKAKLGELDNGTSEDSSEVKIEEKEDNDTDSIEDSSDDNGEQEEAQSEDNQLYEKKVTKAWKEKKKRYQAEAKLKELAEQNEYLRNALNESLNSGTYHYSKNVYSELERQKQRKMQALEEGDKLALVDADIAINNALYAIREIEGIENGRQNQNTQNSSQYQQNYNKPSTVNQTDQTEIISDWLDSHPELQPNSAKYNKDLAQKVSNFAKTIDADIFHSGRSELLYSPEYFDVIDDYISEARKEYQKPQKTNSYSAPNVSGVRNSYSSSTGKPDAPKKVTLSAHEKQIASNLATSLGISEAEYMKYKLKELSKEKNK